MIKAGDFVKKEIWLGNLDSIPAFYKAIFLNNYMTLLTYFFKSCNT